MRSSSFEKCSLTPWCNLGLQVRMQCRLLLSAPTMAGQLTVDTLTFKVDDTPNGRSPRKD